MSKHKSNVNPGQYKVAGRERQGEDVIHDRNKALLAQSRAAAPAKGGPDPFPFGVEANRKSCELSGCSREEMIRRHIREFWPSGRFEAGVSRVDGIGYHRRDGTIVTVDATRREVSYGGRGYEIIVFRDAGERLACEAAQEESAALRSVTELANAAAHEINNPLATLLGSLDFLAHRFSAGSSEAGWARRAKEAGERICDVVAKMQQITRLERVRPAPGISMLDLKKSGEADPPPPSKPEAPPFA